MRAEMIEVVRLAEELRQVGRDRVDEVLHLGAPPSPVEIGAIVAERRHSKRAQSA